MTRVRGKADDDTGRAPTRAAVLAYAEQLRRRAERTWNPDDPAYDPYAKPYYPTSAAASRLCSAVGPEKALVELARRARAAENKQRAEEEDAARSATRHRRRQERAAQTRAIARGRLRPGQRIDLALAGLSIIQAAPAQQAFDRRISIVDGGGSADDASPVPRFNGDPAGKARRVADEAARQIEQLLEQARRRVVEQE